jgi:hypothetical protein
LRHRHTVEQYGVRVEIPTEAHRVSHGSTRSMYTSSWPCFESNGFLFGRRYALSVPTPCPAKLPTPAWEEQTLYRSCNGVVPLRVCTGVYPHGIRLVDETWESRWFGLLGLPPPTVRPVDPLSFDCVSLARRPRGRGRRPGSGEPGERVGALRRPPHVLDCPLRPCPSEILRLVIASPIR